MTDINRLKNEARRYEQREQWPLAIELYSKAINAIEEQGYGTDLSLYNRVGDLYLRQGDTARAVSFYERAVDRYAEQGLQTSAVALCNKVLRIAPGRSELYRTLGRLHAETGLQSQARRSFMEYATRMEKAGELDAAVEALDEFVKLSADEEARITLGRYLIERDRVQEGLTHLRQVLAERTERGEESSEIEALIEQVAPADSDGGPDVDAGENPKRVDHEEDADNQADADQAAAGPVLSAMEAAELDQIIADLGELGLDDDSHDVPPLADAPGIITDSELETLGASITVSDSTLHDLLNEFQDRVVATVEDTDSAIHYDLGIAYREMGLLDDAIREFTTAIQNDHQLLGAHQLLAESLIQKGQYEAGVGAMAEYVRAVGPENDVSNQMERMNELLRASPSEETLSELKQLLRSISDPDSPAVENGAATAETVDDIDVDELFPDLEEAWEATSGDGGSQLEEFEVDEESWPEGSPDHDVEAIEAEATFGAPPEDAEEPVFELDAATAEVETEDTASSVSEAGWEAEAAAPEESGDPETSAEAIDQAQGAASTMGHEDLPLDEDGNALEALSETLAEPLEGWSEPDEFQPSWNADALQESDGGAQDWEPEAAWELEAEVSDDEQPEAELEAEVSDDEQPEAELEAEVSDHEQPKAEEESEDLGGLLFGARLAKFRARMARSASETDFQAHYDLGLAYKEVALFDEAIAELLVAVTGPDALARKSLRLMSEVAHLAADESLHLTTAEKLRENGMNTEALEHLSRVYDDRVASGSDTSDIHRRMNAIDPLYIPASAPEPERSTMQPPPPPEPEIGTPEAPPEDLALVAAGFDSILAELSVADVEADAEAEAPETVEAPDSNADPDEIDGEEDELSERELRAAELLEEGHRDEAVRELYRLQAAYEGHEDFAGAMRAVNKLLLLDPEDVILHHQHVEYAYMLDESTAIANAQLDLGRCLQRQGASSNARSTFESVLEIDPDNASAQAAIAELDQEEAGEDSLPGVADDPVHYETHYELGVAFKQDGLHDEAVYELEIAARGLDDPIPAYELLGELFNEAGQHETTSKVLARALEANDRDDSVLTGVLYQLGISYQELGEIERAEECFRRVFEVDSDYREVAHRLDQCSL